MSDYIIDQGILDSLARLRELDAQGIQVGKVDLHGLTRTYGILVIANALRIKVRTLRSYMDGTRRMPPELLAALEWMYPEFYMKGTVMRHVRTRVRKGISLLPEEWLEINNDFMEE